jgi:hypothetical protein
MKHKKIIYLSIVALFVILSLYFLSNSLNKTQAKCGIESCHGLEITCGQNVPEVCDMMYQAGDRCRQYASCQIIQGKCQLVKGQGFDECKSCVERCQEEFKDDLTKFFDCESQCA